MISCPHCHTQIHEQAYHCTSCGSDLGVGRTPPVYFQQPPVYQNTYQPPPSGPIVYPPYQQPYPQSREATAAKGIGQIFGVDPRIAILALILDAMLFAGEIISFGVLITLSVVVGAIFGFITYKAQISWYGDDKDSAIIKALIMGLLTAIPSPLPAFLYVPSGVIGLIHLIRKR